MKIKPIRTNEEYRKNLKRLEVIFDAPENTSEFYEAEILIKLIDAYESDHFPIDTLQ